MSIDIDSKLMVYVQMDALDSYEQAVEEDVDYEEYLTNMGLVYTSPYFDASPDEWNVGIEINERPAKGITTQILFEIDAARSTILKYTDKEPYFGSVPNVM